MKFIFVISLLVLFSFQLTAQQKPIVSLGTGFSLFNHNNDPNFPDLWGFDFQLEKPFDLFTKKTVFMSIRPGINYKRISEMYQSNGLGNWYEYKSINKTLSVNSKILAGTELKTNNGLKLFGGINLGVYLWSETLKTLNKTNESILDGSIFFDSFYYGFLFGVEPKILDPVILPAFEFSFLPNFTNTWEAKRNVFQFSVLIGINKITGS